MFGIGHGPELIIVLAIALIVLGPGKIPEVAQMLGKGLRELRKASSELQQTFDVNALMNEPPKPPAEEPRPVDDAVTITPVAFEAPALESHTEALGELATASDHQQVEAPVTVISEVQEPVKPKRSRKRAAGAQTVEEAATAVFTIEEVAPARPRRARKPAAATEPGDALAPAPAGAEPAAPAVTPVALFAAPEDAGSSATPAQEPAPISSAPEPIEPAANGARRRRARMAEMAPAPGLETAVVTSPPDDHLTSNGQTPASNSNSAPARRRRSARTAEPVTADTSA